MKKKVELFYLEIWLFALKKQQQTKQKTMDH